jgi:hypothetical protein
MSRIWLSSSARLPGIGDSSSLNTRFTYLHYGTAVIEALILAKVIFDRRCFRSRPRR